MNRFKELRENKGMSLDKLRDIFHVSKSTLSRLENGLIDPKQSILESYAEYFRVSVDYLLGRSNNKNSNTESNFSENEVVERIMSDFKVFLDKECDSGNLEKLNENDLDSIAGALEIAFELSMKNNKKK